MSELIPTAPPFTYENNMKVLHLAEANDSRFVTMVLDRECKQLVSEVGGAGLLTHSYDEKSALLPVSGTNANGQANGKANDHANGNGHANGNYGPIDWRTLNGKLNDRFVACDLRLHRPRRHPYYDRELRILWYENILVKRIAPDATNQIAALIACQKQGWRRRIGYPLPGCGDRDRYRQMLKDLVDRLNNAMLNPVIRFHVDGLAIRWEPVGAAVSV